MFELTAFDLILSLTICPAFFLLFLGALVYDCWKHRNDPPEYEDNK